MEEDISRRTEYISSKVAISYPGLPRRPLLLGTYVLGPETRHIDKRVLANTSDDRRERLGYHQGR